VIAAGGQAAAGAADAIFSDHSIIVSDNSVFFGFFSLSWFFLNLPFFCRFLWFFFLFWSSDANLWDFCLYCLICPVSRLSWFLDVVA